LRRALLDLFRPLNPSLLLAGSAFDDAAGWCGAATVADLYEPFLPGRTVNRHSHLGAGFNLFGEGGGSVEVVETFIGHDYDKKPKGVKKGRGHDHNNKVLALVDRTTGQARAMVVDDLKASTLLPLLEGQHLARCAGSDRRSRAAQERDSNQWLFS
jgi:hypothetical protein